MTKANLTTTNAQVTKRKSNMKKRIAKKIFRRVCKDFNTALFNGYTFGVNPFIEKRTVV